MTKLETFAHTYNITSLSGYNLEVDLSMSAYEYSDSVQYKLFGVSASLKEVDGNKCLCIDSSRVDLGVCRTVKQILKAVIKPKTNINIRISPTDWDIFKAVENKFTEPHEKRRKEAKEQREREESAMPVFLGYESGMDWGDYSIDTVSRIVKVRFLTDREKASQSWGKGYEHKVHEQLRIVEVIESNAVNPASIGLKIGERLGFINYEVRLLTPEQSDLIVKATEEKRRAEKEEADKKAIAEAEKQRIENEEREAQTKATENEELFLWDAGEIYSSAGNKMLHSLGAIFSQKDNSIEVYTTSYASSIPKANTTYSIKDQLKADGFKFDGVSKHWKIDLSDDNAQKTINLLKKYDSKAWPHTVGMARCWECGSYNPISKMEADGGS